jgi:hypothetical protein
MAPNQIVIKTFFDQLITFLGELKEMYPDDPDFPLGLTSVKMMRNMNPSVVVKMFYDTAKPYDSEISSRNENFFLDHSFSDVEDVDFNLLNKLKQYVRGMSAESKISVWVYVENLYKLAKVIAH